MEDQPDFPIWLLPVADNGSFNGHPRTNPALHWHEPPSWWQRGRSQPIDQPQDFPKQIAGHNDLRQLEHDIATMR